MNTEYCVVYCTCPEEETAEQISQVLLAKRLVACLNIVPNITSNYIWKSNFQSGSEVLMVMKTKQSSLQALEKAILAIHPYEFPEFIAMPIIYGNRDYLAWIDEVVK